MGPWKKLLITSVILIVPLFIGLQTAAAEKEAIYSKGSVLKQYNAVFDIPAGASDYTRGEIERFSGDRIKAPERSFVTGFIYELSKTFTTDFYKPITVTLPYRQPVDPEKHVVSIYWYDNELKQWFELENVKIDEENRNVSGQTVKIGYFAIIATDKDADKPGKPVAEPEPEVQEPEVPEPVKPDLTDIDDHWAKNAINSLLDMGAMPGYADNTFRPSQPITRAEFTYAIVKAFNLWAESGYTFGDTVDHWAKNEISIAAANRLVAGYNDREFGPEDPITREQMAAILVKAARLNPATGDLTFSDKDEISPWAYGMIFTATNKNILSGYPDNTFRPQGTASRAEAATVIYKTWQNTTILIDPEKFPVILE
jgi:hypothetical protein